MLNENKQVKDRRLARHPARLTDAKSFMASFVDDYNHEHRHTGIGLNTPADVPYGLAAAKAIQRAATLETRPRNASPRDSAPTTRPDAEMKCHLNLRPSRQLVVDCCGDGYGEVCWSAPHRPVPRWEIDKFEIAEECGFSHHRITFASHLH